MKPLPLFVSVRTVLCWLVVWLAGGAVSAQPFKVQLTELGRFGAGTSWEGNIQILGNYAYLIGGGFRVVDVSDPARMVEVGRFADHISVQHIHVSDGYAYAAAGSTGLKVVDVRNPSQPVLVAIKDTGGYANDVQVSGNHAFVANYTAGLLVLDVSKPDQPVVVGRWSNDGYARRVQVEGRYAYLINQYSGLEVLDISKPTRPVWVGRYASADPLDVHVVGRVAYLLGPYGFEVLDVGNPAAPTSVGTVAMGESPSRIQVVGSHAFVVTRGFSYGSSALQVFDVANPIQPVLVGNYRAGGGEVKIVDDLLYLASGIDGLQVLALRSGLPQTLDFELRREVDFTNAPIRLEGVASSSLPVSYRVASGPALVTGNQLRLTGAGTVELVAEQPGNEFFLAAPPLTNTLKVLPNQSVAWLAPLTNVLALNTPQRLEAAASSGLPVTFRVASGPARIEDGSLIITNVATVVVVAEQPGSAVFCPVSMMKAFNLASVSLNRLGESLGSWPAEGQLELAGHLAYNLVGSSFLVIFDLRDPLPPRRVASIPFDSNVFSIQGRDTNVYVGLQSGLRIMDVSNPAQPVAVADFPTTQPVRDIQVAGAVAYLACGSAGLLMLDVSQPTQPRLLGRWVEDGGIAEVEVAGGVAYLAHNLHDIRMVDVTDPVAPRLLGSQVTADQVRFLRIGGERAYFVEGRHLWVVDVADPARPRRLGKISATESEVSDLWVEGSSAFLGVGNSFQVVDVSNPELLDTVAQWSAPTSGHRVRSQGGLVYAVTTRSLTVYELKSRVAQTVSLRLATEPLEMLTPQVKQVATNQPYALTASSSSGLPVRLSVLAGPGYLEGSSLIVTNPGAVTVVAEQSGSELYLPASTSRTFNRGGTEIQRMGGLSLNQFGLSLGVRKVGDHAYVAAGGLRVLNVADSTAPILVGSAATQSQARDLWVESQVAHVAAGSRGLRLFDVRDPAKPTFLGAYDENEVAMAVQVVGARAYVAGYDAGLLVLDVSDPTQPKRLGQLDTPGVALGVRIAGNVAYVADQEGGLRIVDISNPENPVLVGHYATSGEAVAVAVQGALAVVLDRSAGLLVLDVSEPGSPELLAALPLPAVPVAVDLMDGYAYVAAGDAGISVVDLRNPALPVVAGGYDTSGSAVGLQVTEGRVYVADRDGGVQILNAAVPANLARLGGYNVTGAARGIDVVGNHAFLASDTAGLLVVEVSDAKIPMLLSLFDTEGAAQSVQVLGDLAYVADGPGGLLLLDVSNPIRPRLRSRFATTGECLHAHVRDGLAFVAKGTAGVEIVDVSDSAHPRALGSFNTPGEALKVRLAGPLAYVADGTAGVQILDVSDPARPLYVGGYDTPGIARDVRPVGDLAYVADEHLGSQQPGGFLALNVTEPARPVLWRRIRDVTGISFDVSDGFAWVVDGLGSLGLVDLNLPSPAPVQRVERTSYAFDVKTVGDRVYLASHGGGLAVFGFKHLLFPEIISQFSASGIVFTNGPLSLPAYATAGLPLTFKVISGPALVEENQVRLTGVGSVRIEISHPGSGGIPRTSRYEQLNVVPNQTLTWIAPTNKALALNVPHPLRAEASSGLPVTFRVKSGPADIQNGALVITNLEAVAVVAEQAGDQTFSSAAEVRNFNPVLVEPRKLAEVKDHGVVQGVEVLGTTAYLARGTAGLTILDCRDPSKPVLIGASETGGVAVGVAVEGKYAYVANDGWGLGVMDISDPAHPVRVGGYDTQGASLAVRVVGQHALIADGGQGLVVIDIRDPKNPTFVHKLALGGIARDLAVAGNVAYVAASDAGLKVIDISNPAEPALIRTYSTGGMTTAVTLAGNLAYVTDASWGLRILDVSDPANLAPRASLYAFNASAVEVNRGFAYVGVPGVGVAIIEVSNLALPLFVRSWFQASSLGYFSGVLRVRDGLGYFAASRDGLILADLQSKISQEITWNQEWQVAYTNGPIPLRAIASSGLPVIYKVLEGPGIVQDDLLWLTNAGRVNLSAEQSGDSWLLPAYAWAGFQVSRAPQNVRLGNLPTQVSPLHPLTVPVIQNSELPVSLSVISGPGVLNGNQLTLTGEGTLILRATQAGDNRYEPAEDARVFNVSLAREIGMSLDSLSFVLRPALAADGSELRFTTFDGTNGPPLADDDAGQPVVSGEVRLRASAPGTWAADYLRGAEFGSLTFTEIEPDTTGEGIPDLLEWHSPVDRRYAVSFAPEVPTGAGPFPASLHLLRAAGVGEGDYTVSFSREGTEITHAGRWWSGHADAPAEFDRTARTLRLNLADENSLGLARTLRATVPYALAADGVLELAEFTAEQTLAGQPAEPMLFQTVRLHWDPVRRVYSGRTVVADGDPLTSWPDLREFWITLRDPLDEDADGVPNFVDAGFDPVIRRLPPKAGGSSDIGIEIRAAAGSELILESTTDLGTWREERRVTGQGPASPFKVSLTPSTTESHRFWRLRGP